MTDTDAIATILTSPELQRRTTVLLKGYWKERELEYLRTNGRTAYCDCLFYQVGDYARALEAAQK